VFSLEHLYTSVLLQEKIEMKMDDLGQPQSQSNFSLPIPFPLPTQKGKALRGGSLLISTDKKLPLHSNKN